MENLDFSLFNDEQKRQIESGLEDGLDVSWYAKPEFDWWKMYEIRLDLETALERG